MRRPTCPGPPPSTLAARLLACRYAAGQEPAKRRETRHGRARRRADGEAFPPRPAVAAAAADGGGCAGAAAAAVAGAARHGRGVAVARGGARPGGRGQHLPGAALQRVRDLPALRAAVPLRRGARAAQRRGGCRAGDAGVPPPRHRQGARRRPRWRRAGDAGCRPCASVFLLRRRRGDPQRRGGRRRPAPVRGAGADVPHRPRLPVGLGRGTAARCTASRCRS